MYNLKYIPNKWIVTSNIWSIVQYKKRSNVRASNIERLNLGLHENVRTSNIKRSTLGFDSNVQLSHFKRSTMNKSQHSHFQQTITNLNKPINPSKAQSIIINYQILTFFTHKNFVIEILKSQNNNTRRNSNITLTSVI